MSAVPSIVWFRHDLRLRDNPALRAVAARSGARSVYFNRRYEPAAAARDDEAVRGLHRDGIMTAGFNASLLFEPWEIGNASGGPYQVYGPFRRACLAAPDPPRPDGAPRRSIAAPAGWPRSVPLRDLDIDPGAPSIGRLDSEWRPGEAGALRQLRAFLGGPLGAYGERHDRPDVAGTARLSPHLHFGEIGPRRIWSGLRRIGHSGGEAGAAARRFERQILWREFACHLLHHFPHTPEQPLRRRFASFPRHDGGAALAAWENGRTGYPIVDAGMRELRTTGWMHNRVRMVVASFLVKDLLLPWQSGAAWFWDALVDADLANNTLGWQWTAGCGADAAPFFRIFNPVRQGIRFDPDGAYVRRFVPELAALPARWIHRPFAAPGGLLDASGIRLGSSYPRPIVDHEERCALALAVYRTAMTSPGAAR